MFRLTNRAASRLLNYFDCPSAQVLATTPDLGFAQILGEIVWGMMKNLTIRAGVSIAYEDHCFAPPWTSPQTVVMVHGNAESSRAWTGFVPHLAGTYRVVRPDMPGFGASAEPPGYRWQVDELAADLGRFLDALEHRQVSLGRRQIWRVGRDAICHRAFGSSALAVAVRLAGARQRHGECRQDPRSRRARMGGVNAAGAARLRRVGGANRVVDG